MTRTIAFDQRSRQQTHFTTCYMCACRCGIKVTIESNKIRFIQGNLNHPVNKGVLCAKGSAGIMIGRHGFARVSESQFRRAILGVLAAVAAMGVIRALWTIFA